jgi:hypothetical protein
LELSAFMILKENRVIASNLYKMYLTAPCT